MSKQKKWINKLTSKDEQTLNAFADVGYLTRKMLTEELDLAARRINAFEHDGYIERQDYYNKQTHNVEQAYRLTDKGKKLTKDELDRIYFYKSNSVSHDLALANRYFQEPAEHRNAWITEAEWRDNFKSMLQGLKDTDYDRFKELHDKWEQGEISPPDAGFKTDSGTVVAVEVVTSSYDAKDRQSKISFTEELDIELQIERG